MPAIKHRIERFPFIACYAPNDRVMYRPIMQFKPDGGDRIRYIEWLRQHKPERFHEELARVESEQTI